DSRKERGRPRPRVPNVVGENSRTRASALLISHFLNLPCCFVCGNKINLIYGGVCSTLQASLATRVGPMAAPGQLRSSSQTTRAGPVRKKSRSRGDGMHTCAHLQNYVLAPPGLPGFLVRKNFCPDLGDSSLCLRIDQVRLR